MSKIADHVNLDSISSRPVGSIEIPPKKKFEFQKSCITECSGTDISANNIKVKIAKYLAKRDEEFGNIKDLFEDLCIPDQEIYLCEAQDILDIIGIK